MKNVAIVTVSAVALALAGCGGNPEPKAPATEEGVALDPALPSASPSQTFANTAASSDLFEIEISKLAAEKASSAKVKSFAETMVKHHTESTAKLKSAAGAATPALTPTALLEPAHQQVLESLKSKSGAEFDTAYAAAQVEAHQKALDLLKGYSATGDVPSLKAFAVEAVPVVTAHLNMAKAL